MAFVRIWKWSLGPVSGLCETRAVSLRRGSPCAKFRSWNTSEQWPNSGDLLLYRGRLLRSSISIPYLEDHPHRNPYLYGAMNFCHLGRGPIYSKHSHYKRFFMEFGYPRWVTQICRLPSERVTWVSAPAGGFRLFHHLLLRWSCELFQIFKNNRRFVPRVFAGRCDKHGIIPCMLYEPPQKKTQTWLAGKPTMIHEWRCIS